MASGDTAQGQCRSWRLTFTASFALALGATIDLRLSRDDEVSGVSGEVGGDVQAT
jgi:hypothetical protein